ncbi:beta-lactamase family protein [Aquihabitans sp. G128]|nr:beta-lactamase family protein [Aquihabitans sp. G128]
MSPEGAAPPVVGAVAPGFEAVAEALGREVAGQGGGGAQLAVRHHGQWVLDVAAGSLGPDSLVHTWSAVKPVTATALLLLVAREQVALDTPVRDVWPELRAAGDGRLRVRHVLAHGAGLARAEPGHLRAAARRARCRGRAGRRRARLAARDGRRRARLHLRPPRRRPGAAPRRPFDRPGHRRRPRPAAGPRRARRRRDGRPGPLRRPRAARALVGRAAGSGRRGRRGAGGRRRHRQHQALAAGRGRGRQRPRHRAGPGGVLGRAARWRPARRRRRGGPAGPRPRAGRGRRVDPRERPGRAPPRQPRGGDGRARRAVRLRPAGRRPGLRVPHHRDGHLRSPGADRGGPLRVLRGGAGLTGPVRWRWRCRRARRPRPASSPPGGAPAPWR